MMPPGFPMDLTSGGLGAGASKTAMPATAPPWPGRGLDLEHRPPRHRNLTAHIPQTDRAPQARRVNRAGEISHLPPFLGQPISRCAAMVGSNPRARSLARTGSPARCSDAGDDFLTDVTALGVTDRARFDPRFRRQVPLVHVLPIPRQARLDPRPFETFPTAGTAARAPRRPPANSIHSLPSARGTNNSRPGRSDRDQIHHAKLAA
jgi:hypothetical protein